MVAGIGQQASARDAGIEFPAILRFLAGLSARSWRALRHQPQAANSPLA